MKLNNKGWGLGMMIFLISILIIFFGIAIYFILKFYDGFTNPVEDVTGAKIIEIRRVS